MLLAAEIQTDTLGRSVLIALLVVGPYGIYKVRQVRAARRNSVLAEEARTAPPPPSRPPLESIIDHISTLATSNDGPSTISIPHDVTLDGSDAPPGLIDALVKDALRRSGMAVTAEVETDSGRVIEVAAIHSGARSQGSRSQSS